jgi:hypothetical protein
MAYETSSSLTYHLVVSYVTTFIITAVGKYKFDCIKILIMEEVADKVVTFVFHTLFL